jgi:pimeloyl-ACP methyl ester carboxylesterase
VLLSDHPWTPTEPVFDRRVHAFADMGFAVLRVDPRGTGGRGLAHLHAASGRPDEVQTEDIVFVVDRLAAKLPIDRERVALVGSHYGGRLAVRGLQLRPERFRCAVAIESPVDLDAWFEQARWAGDVSTVLEREYFGDASHRKATSLLREPELVRGSLLLLAYGGPAGQPRRETYLAARRLARTVGAGPGTAVFVELDHDFAANRTASRARVFRRMERFLNSTLYDFAVEEGELRVAPE